MGCDRDAVPDGDLMGKSGGGGRLGSMARVGAVVLASLALANCSASKFSNRVIADGDPVPKGGGYYHVGEPYRINGHTYYPAENPSYRAEGVASWYGPDFHGRLTANGEIFDMHAISAAHPTLPIPSYARVTNLDNGRSMIVRVNDRGPYARSRLIDVSIGAAKALGFYGDGLAHVRVEYVGRAPLDGSDDRALLATLRDGRPAQASPQLMLASTAPFVPGPEEGAPRVPVPAERSFALGTAAGPVAAKPPGSRKVPDTDPARSPSARPVASFAPAQDERALGLMSGRGLY
jgi:rare lipoprotein A